MLRGETKLKICRQPRYEGKEGLICQLFIDLHSILDHAFAPNAQNIGKQHMTLKKEQKKPWPRAKMFKILLV